MNPRYRDILTLQSISVFVFRICAMVSSTQLFENDLGAVLSKKVINGAFYLSMGY